MATLFCLVIFVALLLGLLFSSSVLSKPLVSFVDCPTKKNFTALQDLSLYGKWPRCTTPEKNCDPYNFYVPGPKGDVLIMDEFLYLFKLGSGCTKGNIMICTLNVAYIKIGQCWFNDAGENKGIVWVKEAKDPHVRIWYTRSTVHCHGHKFHVTCNGSYENKTLADIHKPQLACTRMFDDYRTRCAIKDYVNPGAPK